MDKAVVHIVVHFILRPLTQAQTSNAVGYFFRTSPSAYTTLKYVTQALIASYNSQQIALTYNAGGSSIVVKRNNQTISTKIYSVNAGTTISDTVTDGSMSWLGIFIPGLVYNFYTNNTRDANGFTYYPGVNTSYNISFFTRNTPYASGKIQSLSNNTVINVANSYGVSQYYAMSFSGFFVPKMNGWHTFYVTVYDQISFWFSPGTNIFNLPSYIASNNFNAPGSAWNVNYTNNFTQNISTSSYSYNANNTTNYSTYCLNAYLYVNYHYPFLVLFGATNTGNSGFQMNFVDQNGYNQDLSGYIFNYGNTNPFNFMYYNSPISLNFLTGIPTNYSVIAYDVCGNASTPTTLTVTPPTTYNGYNIIDPSGLVYYYTFNVLNNVITQQLYNYASGNPIYDASMTDTLSIDMCGNISGKWMFGIERLSL
jgi:hypothetical protein